MLAAIPKHAAKAYAATDAPKQSWHESVIAALTTVNAALDRTPWADDAAPDSWANVRLTGQQIREIRAAIAAAGEGR